MSVADLTKDLEKLSVSAINKKYKVGIVKQVAKNKGLNPKQKKNDLLKLLKGKKVVKKSPKKNGKKPVKKKKVVKKKKRGKPALPKDVEDIIMDFKKQLESLKGRDIHGKDRDGDDKSVRVREVLKRFKDGKPQEMVVYFVNDNGRHAKTIEDLLTTQYFYKIKGKKNGEFFEKGFSMRDNPNKFDKSNEFVFKLDWNDFTGRGDFSFD